MNKYFLVFFLLISFAFSDSFKDLDFGASREVFFNHFKGIDIKQVKKSLFGQKVYSFEGTYYDKPADFSIYFKDNQMYKVEVLIKVDKISKTLIMDLSVSDLYGMEYMSLYYRMIKALGYPKSGKGDLGDVKSKYVSAIWQKNGALIELVLKGDKHMMDLLVIHCIKSSVDK